eukprot:TRINITY_DN1253_c1_g1_i2.p1 TRINITY_DN1253_c1_g1~~TRINITY_DN1253_c1_g1_i2.p1  ORF type:complete len:1003 (+),score=364.96 TRINITY_DN1253_c1_g1_i2:127-3135(+)
MSESELSFQVERRNYKPEEAICGEIVFEPKHRFDFHGVWLYIKGKIVLPHSIFDRSNPQLSLKKKRKVVVLSQYLILKRLEGNEENVKIPTVFEPSKYVFPFQFILPKDLLPSASYQHGKIAVKYTLVAFADRWGRDENKVDEPWKNAIKGKIPLGIVVPVVPQVLEHVTVPIKKEKTFLNPLGGSGERQFVSLEAQLERNFTWQRDTFRVRINVNNQSAKKLTNISVKLRQTWKYSLKPPSEELTGELDTSKLQTSEIRSTIDRKEYKVSSMTSVIHAIANVSVALPQLDQPSILHCNLFSLTYSVIVRLHMNTSKSFAVEIPITMLSSPLSEVPTTDFPSDLLLLGPSSEKKISFPLKLSDVTSIHKKSSSQNLNEENAKKQPKKSLNRMKDQLYAISGVDTLISNLEKAHYTILINQTHQLVVIEDDADYKSVAYDMAQRIEATEKNVQYLLRLVSSDGSKTEIAKTLKELSLLQDSLVEGVFLMTSFIRNLSYQQDILSSCKCILLSLYQFSIICSHSNAKMDPSFQSLIQIALKRFDASMQELKEALYKAGTEGGQIVEQLGDYHKLLENLSSKMATTEIDFNNLNDSADATKKRISTSAKSIMELVYVLLSLYSVPHDNLLEQVSEMITHIYGHSQQMVADALRYRSFEEKDGKTLDQYISKVLEKLQNLFAELAQITMSNSPPTYYIRRTTRSLGELLSLDESNSVFIDSNSLETKQLFKSSNLQLEEILLNIKKTNEVEAADKAENAEGDQQIQKTNPYPQIEQLLEEFLQPICQIFQFWENIEFPNNNSACHSQIEHGINDIVLAVNSLHNLMKECVDMEKYVENKKNIIFTLEKCVIRVGKLNTFLLAVVASQHEGALNGKFNVLLDKLKQTGCSAYQLEKTVRNMIRTYLKAKESSVGMDRPKNFLAPSSWSSPDIHIKRTIDSVDDDMSITDLPSASSIKKTLMQLQNQFGTFKLRSSSPSRASSALTSNNPSAQTSFAYPSNRSSVAAT